MEKSVDMWAPYKELCNTVEAVLSKPEGSLPPKFVDLLKRHKQNFVTLLKNPPKNSKSRDDLKKGATAGITLPEVGHQILSKDLVDEALIISDMYNLNEIMALDLLCTAQAQMPYHPGLTRGLVAVILYYDGRKSLILALKFLILARKGFTFSSNCSEEISDFVTNYTNELLEDGLIGRMLDLIDSLDLDKEIELLQQNRALGGPKHHKLIVDLFNSIKQNLAATVFYWSAQCGLKKDTALKLIHQLKRTKIQEESTGGIDNVTLSLEMALLCAIDLSILTKHEDSEESVQEYPLIADRSFVQTLLRELSNTSNWECPGLGALTGFAWGLSLATLKAAPQYLHPQEINDEDETTVDSAIEGKVFEFLYRTFLENSLIYQEEFYTRRLHQLFTDFIVLMPVKITELKKKGEDASRTSQMFLQEGIEPPTNLSHHFEHLLLAISSLYAKDPCNLELCLDYWYPSDAQTPYRTQPRQVLLFKFVREAGESVPSLLFVPYLKMLCSLSNSPQAARHCYNMLRQDKPTSVSSSMSWDHFFNSLNRYYSNLRQELPPANDTVYRHQRCAKGITPQEIQGLHAVLAVIRMVAEKDEFSRMALCENPNWSPLAVLLGLVSCSVPILLKADLLNVLAALAKTPALAATLWHNLEASQILTTIPSTSSFTPRGIKTELDEIESRNEEFPLTRALLHLLDVLTDVPVPRLLGVGTRTPGFDPYLHFIVDSVFLKFNNRSYKNPEEKWLIASVCLKLLVKFLNYYEPLAEDFFGVRIEIQGGGTTQINPPPGYHLMINLNNKSELLRMVLHLIDEGVQHLDTFVTFPGKEALENSNLCCLELLDTALALQPKFLSLVTNAGASLLLAGLSKLLSGMNPRSGKPDHMLNITKFVTYNAWLPKHAYHSVRILKVIASQPATQIHLVGLFTSTPTLKTEIRHGFVECLEADDDDDETDDEDDLGIRSKTKEIILELLQQSLNFSSPNIALYLLGFDLNKDIKKMIFQQPGILQTPRTLLHSLITTLNKGMNARTGALTVSPKSKLLEVGYCLLYQLCSNNKTSEPVLRFLRSNHEFLPRHIACLPFKPHKNPSERNQMAWLLKIVAIELKVCAANKQHSQMEVLVTHLVGDQSDEEGRSDDDDETDNQSTFNPRVLDPDFTQSINSSISGQKRNDQRFLRILNLINFNAEAAVRPDWEFFDATEIEAILTRCEVQKNKALRLVDVKKLHRLLTDELAAIQGSSTASQRQLILNEIKEVCEYALERNKLKTKATATLHLMEAWRQVTEIIFAVTPNETLQNDYRQELIIDTIHILLYKIVSADHAIPEIASLASGIVMILLVNLRQCQMLEHREGRDTTSRRNDDTGEITIMLSTLQANSNTLKNILCGILQWMINSGTASQKLRANLYASLLNFLYITCLDSYEEGEEEIEDGDSLYATRLDSSRYRIPNDSENGLRKIILKVISNFGEGLADALCHDCTGGHDVCRMLALSCMDVLVELDPYTPWIGFLSARGYLQHLIDSLIETDDELVELCANDRVSTLRPLYVYESKLVLLSRIASTRDGSILLIEQNAVNCLSSMKVFDVYPKPLLPHELKIDTEFVPSPNERFQQILFPALNLFDTIITSLGTENRSSNEAIVHFLLCHGDMVSSVLRNATPRSPLSNLREIARLTGVIARSADIGQFEEAVQFFDVNRRHGAHSPYLLKTLMLDLIQRFIITDGLIQDIWDNNSLSSRAEAPEFFDSRTDDKIDTILQIFQTACNLMIYIRAAISSKDKIDYRATEPVFWPGLTDQQTADGRSGGRGNGENPLLGYTVQQLMECVGHYHRESSTLAQLKRKMSAVHTMTSSELQQFLPDSPLTTDVNAITENRFAAAKIIRKRLDQKTMELDHCSFLIENCLYVIWSHLDFFMLRALPKPKQGFDFDLNKSTLGTSVTSRETNLMSLTSQDIAVLKNGLIGIFNDNFSKKLIATKENASNADKGFVTALLRRIKRLIQFVPVK